MNRRMRLSLATPLKRTTCSVRAPVVAPIALSQSRHVRCCGGVRMCRKATPQLRVNKVDESETARVDDHLLSAQPSRNVRETDAFDLYLKETTGAAGLEHIADTVYIHPARGFQRGYSCF